MAVQDGNTPVIGVFLVVHRPVGMSKSVVWFYGRVLRRFDGTKLLNLTISKDLQGELQREKDLMYNTALLWEQEYGMDWEEEFRPIRAPQKPSRCEFCSVLVYRHTSHALPLPTLILKEFEAIHATTGSTLSCAATNGDHL